MTDGNQRNAAVQPSYFTIHFTVAGRGSDTERRGGGARPACLAEGWLTKYIDLRRLSAVHEAESLVA